jgi:hypothetical protein
MRRNDHTALAIEVLCDTGFDLMYDSATPARVLTTGICTLFPALGYTHLTNPLAYYIQWPICADRIQTVEPFKPVFNLWRRGVKWRLTEDKVAEVFTLWSEPGYRRAESAVHDSQT